MFLTRSPHNPILSPEPTHDWESWAVFNATAHVQGTETTLLYRAIGDEIVVNGKKLRQSIIGRATSSDGYCYDERAPFITPTEPWECYGCEDPRLCTIDGTHYIFYTAIGNYPPNYQGIRLAVAISDDLKTVRERHLVAPFNAKAMTLFPEKVNGKYLAFLSVNTDRPPASIAYAQFDRLEDMWSEEYWNAWYQTLPEHTINLKRMNTDGMEIGANPIKTSHGWLLFYSYIKHYFNPAVPTVFRVEAVLLDEREPWRIIGRIPRPLLIPEESYELDGTVPNIVFPSAATAEGDSVRVYYGGADTHVCMATGSITELLQQMEVGTPTTVKCEKFAHNPLLRPVPDHEWEAVSVFNPAAVAIDGTTYILYRAQSRDNTSRVGLAISRDGKYIDERLSEPIYQGRADFELPQKAGMPSGCEDPRVTRIGDTLHLLYTAYNGVVPRLARSSISVERFLARDWEAWTAPVALSEPHEANKDGVLFPEKLNGSFVLFHRVEPNISIDMVDTLQMSGKTYLSDNPVAFPRNKSWDEVKIGINTPPIRTDQGWLTLYHGISFVDHQYRVGAMLFDLQNPERLIARTPYPILEPERSFETQGLVNNVVFPCGWVLRDQMLYIYYGGADSVVCGATIGLDTLLDYMYRSKTKQHLALS